MKKTSSLVQLLENNRAWAERMEIEDPSFFKRLANQQAPQYLWIGCSDSRVPANQITGLAPGEVFVHRNIANIVAHTDLNCLSVLQFGIELLKVKHILVVGHYGCSGVKAALEAQRVGLADNWLRHVQDVVVKHENHLSKADSPEDGHSLLCELHVIEQTINVCQTTVVQDAWARGQSLAIHGWIYDIKDGRVRDLGITIENNKSLPATYQQCLKNVGKQR